ncbi:uncharacterized protein PAC_00019 [Phialocephala subalpina]|uniref:BTB domain-containing protein n=1 Tax=Phialocephala subalpina TaxID=576137 RepID=A0A1L7WBI5_9HELO|nr:uncharacterized protein PAC_00019 [Phialocephala subalpina]
MPTLSEAAPDELMHIITSENFILIPSNSNTAFKIPKALLSSVSKPFGASAEGGWIETSNGSHKFLVQDENGSEADVTENVLVCFIKWAFTGQYSTDDVGISSQVDNLRAFEYSAVEEENHIQIWGTKKGKKGLKKHVSYVLEPPSAPELVEETAPEPEWETTPEPAPEPEWETPPEPAQEQWETSEVEHDPGLQTSAFDAGPSKGKGPEEEINLDYDSKGKAASSISTQPAKKPHALLLHVQIYVFANIYQIEELKRPSRQNITAYLEKVERSSDDFTHKIFDVLDYAFLHLPDDDKLLMWLAKYSAWKLGTLRENSVRLEELLRGTDGKFSTLLVHYVVPGQANPFIREWDI